MRILIAAVIAVTAIAPAFAQESTSLTQAEADSRGRQLLLDIRGSATAMLLHIGFDTISNEMIPAVVARAADRHTEFATAQRLAGHATGGLRILTACCATAYPRHRLDEHLENAEAYEREVSTWTVRDGERLSPPTMFGRITFLAALRIKIDQILDIGLDGDW